MDRNNQMCRVMIVLLWSSSAFFARSAGAQGLASHGGALLRCAAVYNVLAVSLPNQLGVDQEARETRDFFAGMAQAHFELASNRRVADAAINDGISDELERLEELHREGRSLESIVSACLVWERKLIQTVGKLGPNPSETQQRRALTGIAAPTGTEIVRMQSSARGQVFSTVRTRFRLWGSRGYMTPRKAKRKLGL